ncbi:uncharacterized protein FA14DRAFT_189914 [Meira miltonrushii]|uniref:Cytochrome c oxidase assembly protein PET191 n=1 Tax=Meira miltonrushii TaxID=1280837 RepID=A0A316VEI0_9BASI|nr:uncharacterized protein FA14DRAFT_189914 [Meira miltonrushii]PWN35992.1 hypothetical protein FA14DRAFT_189914 [Meira miltonrushii]
MNSCRAIRDELAACLSQSECVQSGKSGQDCLRNHMDELPEDCQAVYKSYVHCRRGLLDMRKRFRGNAPATTAGNPAPGGTSTVASSAATLNEQSSARSANDPSSGLSPEQAE